MKKLFLFIVVILVLPYAAEAQEVKRCFHLDKVSFMRADAALWKRHTIASAAARPVASLNPKFLNITELNGGIGLYDVSVPYSKRFYGVTTVNGLLLRNKIGIGLGLGAESYNDGWQFPVYGDARYFFDLGYVSIFALGEGGVKLSIDDLKNKSHLFVSPGVGVALPLTPLSKIVISAGLLSQWQLDDRHRDSFINLRVGMLFKGK